MGDAGGDSELDRRWAEAATKAVEMASCDDATQAAWMARAIMLDWPEAPLPPLLGELLTLNDELEETIRQNRPVLLHRYRELASRIAAEAACRNA
jgi:hypothetical protein